MDDDDVPPDTVHHYEDISEVPDDIQKYWCQRYDIFSKYDEGVWLTDEAWYGVTPEPIAQKIASDLAKAAPPEKDILIDPFAGVGGNTIAFALSSRWSRIYANERDPDALACAKHNAKVYNVGSMRKTSIWWACEDSFLTLKKRFRSLSKRAIIFASPPWGGPGYCDAEVFDADLMEPYSLPTIHVLFSQITDDFVLYLPRTSDLQQIARYAKDKQKLVVTHYCMRGASKALCVFFGKLSDG